MASDRQAQSGLHPMLLESRSSHDAGDPPNNHCPEQAEAELDLTTSENPRHSNRDQGQRQETSLPRGQAAIDRTHGLGSLTRGHVPLELLPVPSEICQRDTRVQAALFIALLLGEVIHSCSMAYRSVSSRRNLGLSTDSSDFMAAVVIFPLLVAMTVIPAILWLLSNAWEICQSGLWAKMKLRGGFIAYHISVGLSTTLYVTFVIYLIGSNYNGYLDTFSTNATCFCTDVTDPSLGITQTLYQCSCHVPDENTTWMVSSTDLDLIGDASLQRAGSNYTGGVQTLAFNSSVELHVAEEAYFPDFKKFIYCIQMSVLAISLRAMCWGWTSDYGGRDMTHLDASITAPFLREHRAALLQYSLYTLIEGVDVYCLLTDLMVHGRQLASNRPMANGMMAVFGIGCYVVHLLMPFAFVRCLPGMNPTQAGGNKVKAFFSSLQRTITASKVVSVVLNVMLLLLRVALFKRLGGFLAMDVPNLVLLLMLKEFYTIWQKGSEFCIEWWDMQKEEHYDDD